MMYCDRRVGGIESWYLHRPDDWMQLPDEIRKCVAFVCYEDNNRNIHLAGTAFFVSKRLAPDSYGDNPPFIDRNVTNFCYAVTAAHVINAIADKCCPYVILRVNDTEGGTLIVKTPTDDWRRHDSDPTIDVAVLRFSLAGAPKKGDYISYPTEGFVSQGIVSSSQIGPGDDLFVVGLVSQHFGASRNIPIVRIGNIAAMPEEPVRTQFGPMTAYLVETRSIGGLSGSPVFVNLGYHRFINGKIQEHKHPFNMLYLLGLIHGHFALPSEQSTEGDIFPTERQNMGITIVTPATKIAEVLNQPFIMQKEQEALRQLEKQNNPVMDSLETQQEFTREDFENVLRKVSRRIQPSQPDEEK